MMRDANRYMDVIFMFIGFSDQFSYIKHFYLSYHLKVIKIIVFIYLKQKRKKFRKVD